MDDSIYASSSTIRPPNCTVDSLSTHIVPTVSVPSSPRSSALPSPPDSPSSDSVSSLPSVSSSFFFSSSAASPHHSQLHSEHPFVKDSTQGLVIPSLTLPAALRRPTQYGKTLGDLRILVLGSKDAGKGFLSGLLLEDNEDVVEAGTWEDTEYGRTIYASTDWVEHRDAHGLENFEPARNIEIVELPGYDSTTDADTFIQTLTSIIQAPFYSVSEVLDPTQRPSPVLAGLISSPSTPLYTVLIFLLPSPPTIIENLILDTLCPQIPIIVLPRLSTVNSQLKLSSFRPPSAVALRSGLFHSPETIAVLRSEATDRFLRWREVEKTVDDIHMCQRNTSHHHRDPNGLPWDKTRWEAEWVATLSHDVAKRLREGTITKRSVKFSMHDEHVHLDEPSRSYLTDSPYDPLHFPSLVAFSISLLGPLRSRMRRSFSLFLEAALDLHVQVALIGGFCIGVGAGMFLKSTTS